MAARSGLIAESLEVPTKFAAIVPLCAKIYSRVPQFVKKCNAILYLYCIRFLSFVIILFNTYLGCKTR